MLTVKEENHFFKKKIKYFELQTQNTKCILLNPAKLNKHKF